MPIASHTVSLGRWRRMFWSSVTGGGWGGSVTGGEGVCDWGGGGGL